MRTQIQLGFNPIHLSLHIFHTPTIELGEVKKIFNAMSVW